MSPYTHTPIREHRMCGDVTDSFVHIIQTQLYPLHDAGPVPRQFRRPGVSYPRLDYKSGISR